MKHVNTIMAIIWVMVFGVVVGMALPLLRAGEAAAQTTTPQPPGYQVDFWWVAKANEIHVYYYRDEVMRCIIFRETGQGMTPVCLFPDVRTSSQPTKESYMARPAVRNLKDGASLVLRQPRTEPKPDLGPRLPPSYAEILADMEAAVSHHPEGCPCDPCHDLQRMYGEPYDS